MCIEYRGERPARNVNPNTVPPVGVVQQVADLSAACLQMQQNRQVFVVNCDAEAQRLLDQFDKRADREMRGQNEVTQQMWNRAHIKALRLSALVAVGVSYTAPLVTHDIARWSIDMIEKDVSIMLDRFAAGDFGEGDAKLQTDLCAVIRQYISFKTKAATPYQSQGCIPMRVLMQKTACRAAFRKHRNGATAALKDALAALVTSGVLVQLDAKAAKTMFNTTSLIFGLGDQWDK